MKTVNLLFGILTLLPNFSLAGPGVSSGDDSRQNYTCTDRDLQDSSPVVIFTDIMGEEPTVGLSLGTGETSTRLVQGICSRLENIDEFFLNCAIADGFDIYKITLHTRNENRLYSTVEKMETNAEKTSLPCYLNEK